MLTRLFDFNHLILNDFLYFFDHFSQLLFLERGLHVVQNFSIEVLEGVYMSFINDLAGLLSATTPEVLVATVALAALAVAFQALRVVCRLIDRRRDQ